MYSKQPKSEKPFLYSSDSLELLQDKVRLQTEEITQLWKQFFSLSYSQWKRLRNEEFPQQYKNLQARSLLSDPGSFPNVMKLSEELFGADIPTPSNSSSPDVPGSPRKGLHLCVSGSSSVLTQDTVGETVVA